MELQKKQGLRPKQGGELLPAPNTGSAGCVDVNTQPGKTYTCYEFTRRVLDILVALLVAVVMFPLFLVVAALIRLTSPGAVLYRQTRVGQQGHPFALYKFRTMIVGAEHKGAGLGFEANDSRITAIGRLLRKTSIDELPQLVNILRGEASVIGPRPMLPQMAAKLSGSQLRRFEIKPGLTGWAQVNGRNEIPWSERIRLDVWYVNNRSWRLDLHILARTAKMVVLGEGIRQDQRVEEVDDL